MSSPILTSFLKYDTFHHQQRYKSKERCSIRELDSIKCLMISRKLCFAKNTYFTNFTYFTGNTLSHICFYFDPSFSNLSPFQATNWMVSLLLINQKFNPIFPLLQRQACFLYYSRTTQDLQETSINMCSQSMFLVPWPVTTRSSHASWPSAIWIYFSSVPSMAFYTWNMCSPRAEMSSTHNREDCREWQRNSYHSSKELK